MSELYPECAAGGFSRADGAVQFYTRVNALLHADMTVLDFGAGRGRFAFEETSPYRRSLRLLQGKVAEVIGADIDPVVAANPHVDRALVLTPGAALPLADHSVDLIVADATFEHVAEPAPIAGEFARILRPGGWICARTPNRLGYIGLGGRLVPNRWHAAVLKRLQPTRQARDIFPTHYKLNSFAALRRHFPASQFADHSYSWNNEPAYAGHSRLAWRAMQLAFRLTPEAFGATLMVFLQKKTGIDQTWLKAA